MSCQSSSGFSSTSSFSEDESSELDHTETQSREGASTNTRPIFSRQNSVSLEDITVLSNFNSNYYALDFSPNSPARNCNTNKNGSTKQQNENTSLVKECRKIEASLRALSAGCLFEKKLRRYDSNPDLHGCEQHNFQHTSFENLKKDSVSKKVLKASPSLQRNSQSSSTSSLRKFSQPAESSSPKLSPLHLSIVKRNNSVDRYIGRNLSLDGSSCKGSSGLNSPIDIYLDDDDDVFLGFDFMSNPASIPGSPLTENIFKKNLNTNSSSELDRERFDQVDVQFKPERTAIVNKSKSIQKEKESKDNVKSVFGMLKSKVLQVFNIDDKNGAKSNNMNHSASMPLSINNHIKEISTTPDLPNDLITMAAKLNFAVREFPLSSFANANKEDESSQTLRSNIKQRVRADSSDIHKKSPMASRRISHQKDSFEEKVKSPRTRKRSDVKDSHEKNVKSPKQDRRQDKKLSLNQFQRTNSGSDLLKSAIRNSTIQQTSPTMETNRSNPFIVRSFSSDYVEDPSTAYPFKNMKECDNDVLLESPKEMLSVEQTLYDCYIKIDVDKIPLETRKTKLNTVFNPYVFKAGTTPQSFDSSESKRINEKTQWSMETDSHEVFDDHLEDNDPGYYGEHSGISNDGIKCHKRKDSLKTGHSQNKEISDCYMSEYSQRIDGGDCFKPQCSDNKKNGDCSKSDHSETKERSDSSNSKYSQSIETIDHKNLNDSFNMHNGSIDDENCISEEIDWNSSDKRSQKMTPKKKSQNNANRADTTKSGHMCNADDKISPKPDNLSCLAESCNGMIVNSDIVPEVSCVGKAVESTASTKLCRYYHVFREGELETLISSHIKDLHIVQCFYDHANWCLVAVKVDTDSHIV